MSDCNPDLDALPSVGESDRKDPVVRVALGGGGKAKHRAHVAVSCLRECHATGALGGVMRQKLSIPSESRVSGWHSPSSRPLPTAAPASGDRHTPRCSICRSPDLGTLEILVVQGIPIRQLARQFGFSERAVRRHVRWYGLDLIRVLQDCVDRGVDFRARATPDVGLRALACLDRFNQRDALDLWVKPSEAE